MYFLLMDEDTLRRFGEQLKQLRKNVAISQEDLAEKASLDRTYISLLERGKRNPSLLCLISVASALGVTLSELCKFKYRKSSNA